MARSAMFMYVEEAHQRVGAGPNDRWGVNSTGTYRPLLKRYSEYEGLGCHQESCEDNLSAMLFSPRASQPIAINTQCFSTHITR